MTCFSLTPGRVFVSLVIFCVVLCTSCNFYQVYWDSACSGPGATSASAGHLGNYNIVIWFLTSQQHRFLSQETHNATQMSFGGQIIQSGTIHMSAFIYDFLASTNKLSPLGMPSKKKVHMEGNCPSQEGGGKKKL